MMKAQQLVILVLAVVVTVGATRFVDGFGRRGLQHALDTLASNEILRRAADSLRWEVQLATISDDLGDQLRAASDSTGSLEDRTAVLIAKVESLQGRVQQATEVSVSLIAALRTDSAWAEVFAAAPDALPDSITSPYDDGLLSGRIAFYPPVTEFGLEYTAQIRGTLVTAELPDGRWSVFAAAEDTARVRFDLPRVFIDPADPVAYCSIVQRGRWGGLGGLIGYLVGSFGG
ncbi:hypothetical protein LCGC14_0686270 [marine sediment metagenome]|uniref:Uncharacterized protein n=1 Tax=marine sediment metagenome TaxID=412755 RepID=A0A0F9QLT7_9ZZZZ